MGLENLTDSLSKAYNTTKDFTRQNKGYLIAASMCTAVKVSDIIFTHACASKYGDFGLERNPILRYSMEKFGVEAGLLIPTLAVLTAILVLTYHGNKEFPETKLGNKALYLASGVWGFASLHNLLLAYA